MKNERSSGQFLFVLAPILVSAGMFLAMRESAPPATRVVPDLAPAPDPKPALAAAIAVDAPVVQQKTEAHRAPKAIRPAPRPEPEPELVAPPPVVREEPPPPVEEIAAEAKIEFGEPEPIKEIVQPKPSPATRFVPPPRSAPMPRAPLTIAFQENLEWFRATKVEIFVDGKLVASKQSQAGLERKGLELYAGQHFVGKHSTHVKVTLAGEGGAFSYLDGYTFTLTQNGMLNLEQRDTTVMITAFDRGDVTSEWKDRVALRVNVLPVARAAL